MAEEEPTLVLPDEPAKPTPPSKQARRIAKAWRETQAGGAPISPEFVQAALDQGLGVQDIRAILRNQALGGPRTSGSYSSPELLDYFTANPADIPGLLEAVRSTRNAPESYAEYLAQGGEPGAYRSQNQLLQEAVLGIGGARQAYLAGTTRQMFIDAGNDPNQWYAKRDEFMAEQAGIDQDEEAGMPDLSMNELSSFASTAQKMLASRQRRAAAQGDYFSQAELSGDEI